MAAEEPGSRCRRCGEPPDEGGSRGPCRRCGAPEGAPGPPGEGSPGPAAALLAPLRGGLFVLRHPRLLPWILLPLLVDAVLLVLLAAAAVSYFDTLAPRFEEPWWGWIDWLRGAAAWGALHLLRLLALASAFFATLAAAGAVNAPFHDVLSGRTEDLALGIPDPGRPWSRLLPDALRAAGAALLLLAVQAAVLLPLLLLGFTAAGAPVFAAAGAWFAGLGAVDVTLGRKRYGGRERLRWAIRRWPLVLGLGLPLSLLPLLQPLAVVGATLLYLGQADKEPGPPRARAKN